MIFLEPTVANQLKKNKVQISKALIVAQRVIQKCQKDTSCLTKKKQSQTDRPTTRINQKNTQQVTKQNRKNKIKSIKTIKIDKAKTMNFLNQSPKEIENYPTAVENQKMMKSVPIDL